MAALHESLGALCPVSYDEVPTTTDELKSYLANIFTTSQLLVESVPAPPPPSSSAASRTRSNTSASSASEILSSSLRSLPPAPKHAALQKEWGKPIKLPAKDNPLEISVYKLGAKDGKGSWFARRSVHEGLPFERWKLGLQREFPEGVAVQGGPGAGSVRGIGGEKRVEFLDVKGTGRMEVYHLSAQFPGPTTPRDFVTLLLTSDSAMEGTSEGKAPRHFMIISKPCDHPEYPPGNGFIRGKYESIEFIREVPSQGAGSEATNDSEANEPFAVEWIMITRSDPGGSVPRFMVDRGTPGSIVADASKFLDWACKKEHPPTEELEEEMEQVEEETTEGKEPSPSIARTVTPSPPDESTNTGIISSITNVASNVKETIETLAHDGIQDGLFETLQRPSVRRFSSSSSSSSIQSFASAESGFSSLSAKSGTSFVKLSEHEKQMEKLASKKARLDAKLAKTRSKEQKDASGSSEKELARIKRAEEKHAHELDRVQQKHEKELARLRSKRDRESRKESERKEREARRTKEKKERSERESNKIQLERVTTERDMLKQTVRSLQSENTKLVAAMGKLEGGEKVLKELREAASGSSESLNRKAESVKSVESKKS